MPLFRTRSFYFFGIVCAISQQIARTNHNWILLRPRLISGDLPIDCKKAINHQMCIFMVVQCGGGILIDNLELDILAPGQLGNKS